MATWSSSMPREDTAVVEAIAAALDTVTGEVLAIPILASVAVTITTAATATAAIMAVVAEAAWSAASSASSCASCAAS